MMKAILVIFFLVPLLLGCPAVEEAGRGDRILSTGGLITYIPNMGSSIPVLEIIVEGGGLTTIDRLCLKSSSSKVVCTASNVSTTVQFQVEGEIRSICARYDRNGELIANCKLLAF